MSSENNAECSPTASAAGIDIIDFSPASNTNTEKNEVACSPPSNRCVIDLDTLPCKMAYVFIDGIDGTLVYLLVFLTSLGLNVEEAGFICGIRLVVSAFVCPLCGYLADRTGRRKTVFIVLSVGSIVAVFPLPWIGHALKGPASNSMNMRNVSLGNINRFHGALQLNLSSLLNDSNKTFPANHNNTDFYHIADSHQKPFASNLFYVMLTMVVIATAFTQPVIGILDSFVMNQLKHSATKAEFGIQRRCGSVSFGLSALLAGLAADHYNNPEMSPYTATFFAFLPFATFLVPTGIVVASKGTWEVTELESLEKKGKIRLWVSTFRKLDNILFLVSVFLSGVAYALIVGYRLQLMEDKMHATKTNMGHGVDSPSIRVR